jgi:hypothetical protein
LITAPSFGWYPKTALRQRWSSSRQGYKCFPFLSSIFRDRKSLCRWFDSAPGHSSKPSKNNTLEGFYFVPAFLKRYSKNGISGHFEALMGAKWASQNVRNVSNT